MFPKAYCVLISAGLIMRPSRKVIRAVLFNESVRETEEKTMKAKVIQAYQGAVPVGGGRSIAIEQALNDFLQPQNVRPEAWPKVVLLSQSETSMVDQHGGGMRYTTITIIYEGGS